MTSTLQRFFKHGLWDTHALLIARVLMGGMFLLAGIQKLQAIDGVAGYIASVGLPAPLLLAWLAAIFEVLAGASLILGMYFREAAILVALFTFIVAFLFHGPNAWQIDQFQQMLFIKDMAIFSGLLFMAAHGAGRTWTLKL